MIHEIPTGFCWFSEKRVRVSWEVFFFGSGFGFLARRESKPDSNGMKWRGVDRLAIGGDRRGFGDFQHLLPLPSDMVTFRFRQVLGTALPPLRLMSTKIYRMKLWATNGSNKFLYEKEERSVLGKEERKRTGGAGFWLKKRVSQKRTRKTEDEKGSLDEKLLEKLSIPSVDVHRNSQPNPFFIDFGCCNFFVHVGNVLYLLKPKLNSSWCLRFERVLMLLR
ncbi:hypothetical protein BT93_G2416 [Corymbia citriodora subsp. variegata]|nr:hypothetical protein BT93_G2416 [Corymbia citriodora subsp. variegata]